MARVLVACESSGTVRDAFRALGHHAVSVDLLPTAAPGPHWQADVLPLLRARWDLVIAHPPCTYLANSGVRWLHTDPGRWPRMVEGANFFAAMFQANSPRLAVENPLQHRHAVEAHGLGRPSQVVQPWQFGHAETKATGLWLRGLPPLMPTTDLRAVVAELPASVRGRIHHLPPSADRWRLRSVTYSGIAAAMASQWL